MLRSPHTYILSISVMLFLVGITFYVLLSQPIASPVGKQVKETTPHPSTFSGQGTGARLPQVPDTEKQLIVDTLAEVQTLIDISDFPDPSDPDFMNKVRIRFQGITGRPSVSPQIAAREAFAVDLDYYRFRLAFYKEAALKAEGTKYQETFSSAIENIENAIAEEKARIAEAENRHKAVLEDSDFDTWLLQQNALMAGINALPEADRDIFLKHILPTMRSDGEWELSDEVFDKILDAYVTSDTDDLNDVSVSNRPSRPEGKSETMPMPVENIPLPKQIETWDTVLNKVYPDIFPYTDRPSREVFSNELSSETTRQYFRDRQNALQQSYAALLEVQLKDMPQQKREQAIDTARETLSTQWDRDFSDAVINRLQKNK